MLSRESKEDGSQATVKEQFCDVGGEKRSQNDQVGYVTKTLAVWTVCAGYYMKMAQ